MKIQVENLPFDMSEPDVRDIFAAFGKVDQVELGRDPFTGQSRGFALVEMPNPNEARRALRALNGTELDSHPLSVIEAPAGASLDANSEYGRWIGREARRASKRDHSNGSKKG